mmetsp:Transcript_30686/g.46778  ORF Transcript_30686/g.46778 Transcript_30686/m.46778 type:complete len:213 (-) Transcript_30686:290-928(-)|eukprot:CAMPEP_0194253538 /NCGR_PEP_ID=MMETSP0158-20130606/30084_1 /TAXON_ID=33649 /ORGANISM="Thalassionema nitzschioides, Strain L26-B" /LENGTH=212 /DNA_ID=CAMNT_0038991277 /DNA_START=101 /DNA_END=739 /DNA_ORIENTATION=+
MDSDKSSKNEPEMTKWERFRHNGIRPTKSLVTSAGDIAGDWYFYYSIVNDVETLDKYELPLLIFAVISSLLGLLLVINIIYNEMKNHERRHRYFQKFNPFNNAIKIVLGCQIILEDVPQFVLAALVTSDRGSMSSYVVFTLVTSAINTMLNVLDFIEWEEKHHDEILSLMKLEVETNEADRGNAGGTVGRANDNNKDDDDSDKSMNTVSVWT